MERGGNNSCRVSETRAGILPRHLIARLNGPLTERRLFRAVAGASYAARFVGLSSIIIAMPVNRASLGSSKSRSPFSIDWPRATREAPATLIQETPPLHQIARSTPTHRCTAYLCTLIIRILRRYCAASRPLFRASFSRSSPLSRTKFWNTSSSLVANQACP